MVMEVVWCFVVVVLFVLGAVWISKKKKLKAERNMIVPVKDLEQMILLRSGKWNQFQPAQLIPHKFNEQQLLLRAGMTFTPYADSLPCTAHCTFCSETLERTDQSGPNPYDKPKLRQRLDHTKYFKAFQEVLEDFISIPFPLGLSLSGLEATADVEWVLLLCQLISHPRYRSVFDEKVIYSNGSGFVDQRLLKALNECGFHRLELSRQHYDDSINQKIMRFQKDIEIRQNEVYQHVIRSIRSSIPNMLVKNCCLLTKTGIGTIEEMEKYILWGKSLGVQEFVFRELCQLSTGPGGFVQNRTKTWIDDNRVPMD